MASDKNDSGAFDVDLLPGAAFGRRVRLRRGGVAYAGAVAAAAEAERVVTLRFAASSRGTRRAGDVSREF